MTHPTTITNHDSDIQRTTSSLFTSSSSSSTSSGGVTSKTTTSSSSKQSYMWKIPKVTGKAPSARFGHSTALFTNSNGHETMLVFGGWDGVNMLNDLYLFDLVTQEWSKPEVKGKIPTPRAGQTTTTLYNIFNRNRNDPSTSMGKVLLIGGGNGQHYLSDLHVLDLATMEWSQPPVSSQVKVYIKDDLLLNQNIYKDCITDSNTPPTPTSPTNSSSISSTSNPQTSSVPLSSVIDFKKSSPDEEEVVLIGTQTAEIIDTGFGTPSKNAKLNNKTMVTMKEIYPAPRSRHSVVVTKQGKLIMFGGGGSRDKIFDDLWVLDPVKMEWSQPKTFNKPSKRWGHSGVIIDNRMYIFGGVYDSKMLNELYEMDTDTYQWRQIALPKTGPQPAPRAAHTMNIVLNKYLLILWGGDDNRFLDDLIIVDLEYTIAKRLTFRTPKARCAHTALKVDEKIIYVFGGGDKSTRFKELYMLDIETTIEKSGIVSAVESLPKPIPLETNLPSPNEPDGAEMERKQEQILTDIVQKADQINLQTHVAEIEVVQPEPAITEAIEEQPMLPQHETQQSVDETHHDNQSSKSAPPPPPLPPKLTFQDKKPILHHSGSHQFMSVRTEVKVDDASNEIPKPLQTKGKRRRISSRGSFSGDSQVYSARDAKEITNWLVEQGLGRYAGIFVHEEIDMDCVPLLTEADLFRIGVNKYGPRKKILAAARELASSLDMLQHKESEVTDATNQIPENNTSPHSEEAERSTVIPPPPPPLPNLSYHKSYERQLSQLTQAVSNLSMACESMNEAMKTMAATMTMMMSAQLNPQQQQQFLSYMRSPVLPGMFMPPPTTNGMYVPQPQPQQTAFVPQTTVQSATESNPISNNSVQNTQIAQQAQSTAPPQQFQQLSVDTGRASTPTNGENRKKKSRRRKSNAQKPKESYLSDSSSPLPLQPKPSWYEVTEMEDMGD